MDNGRGYCGVWEKMGWGEDVSLGRKCGLRMNMGSRMVIWGRDGAEEKMGPGMVP
jgi:hypothetical protein